MNTEHLTDRQKSLLETFATIREHIREEERKNPEIAKRRKQYAGMTFNEVRDAYDATPEGKKEFKERYGIEMKV